MNISGKLHDWHVFVTVIDQGSFSAAAKHLGVSVSTVSKQISRLEEGVNSILINRDTHNLHLTQAGSIAYEKSIQVIEMMDGLITSLRNPSQIIKGSIKLTAPSLVCEFMANHWLSEYLDAHKNVSVFLESRESNQFSKESSIYDHLILRSGFIESDELVHRQLSPLQLSICAARDYIEKNGCLSHPQELHKHDFLWVHQYGFNSAHNFFRGDDKYTLEKTDEHRYACDNILSAYNLMARGKGICITTPGFKALNMERYPEVITIMDDWKIESIPVYLIWRHRRYYSALFKDFIEFISDKWEARTIIDK